MGVLLYDGDCAFCTSSAGWLRRHVISASPVMAWHHADLTLLGLNPGDSAEAVQWVEAGQRAVGPDAITAYLQSSTHSWRAVGRVLSTPVLQYIASPIYHWLGRHRDRLPGRTPASELPRVPTTIEGIRRRRHKDLGACARLLRVVFSEGEYPLDLPDAPRAWLDGDDVIEAWIVEHRREILGHIAISKVGMDALSALRWQELTGHGPSELAGVSRFFVRPSVRRQGIGSALLDVAAAEILARGLTPVTDVTSTSKDAIRLVEERGWRLLALYPCKAEAGGLRTLYYASRSAARGS